MELLDRAFGSEPRSQQELLRRAWPALTTGDADRVFALYFEVVGLASAPQPPYDEIAPAMLAGWVEWLMPRTLGSSPDIRRRRALATVAQIDGLLLVRQVLGPEPADAAARELGLADTARSTRSAGVGRLRG